MNPRTTRSRSARPLALAALLAVSGGGPQASAQQDFELRRDQTFAVRDGEPLRADVRIPPGSGPHPAVVVLHPGGWTAGSKELMNRVAEKLARRDYVAVSPSYRLAPEHPFPAALEDVRAAVRWVRRNAASLRVDPARVGAYGYSAGANLAALLATRQESDDGEASSRVQALVVGGTPADLWLVDSSERVRAFLGGEPHEVPERYDRASPIRSVSPDDPPTFVYHGRNDWMIDPAQGRAFAAALRRVGVPTEYRETRLGHFASWIFETSAEDAAFRFLDRWLGASRVASAGLGADGAWRTP